MRAKFSYAKAKLRPLAEGDYDLTLIWRNQPSIRASMYTTHVIGSEEHARWLGRVTTSADYSYHIFEYDGRALGMVGFYCMSKVHRRGEWTFYVGEPGAPRRAGRAMLFIAADFFFGGLHFNKLCGDVIVSNSASALLHERLGFKVEGTRRRHIWRDGQPEDVRMYALFAQEWHAARRSLFEDLFTYGLS